MLVPPLHPPFQPQFQETIEFESFLDAYGVLEEGFGSVDEFGESDVVCVSAEARFNGSKRGRRLLAAVVETVEVLFCRRYSTECL